MVLSYSWENREAAVKVEVVVVVVVVVVFVVVMVVLVVAVVGVVGGVVGEGVVGLPSCCLQTTLQVQPSVLPTSLPARLVLNPIFTVEFPENCNIIINTDSTTFFSETGMHVVF